MADQPRTPDPADSYERAKPELQPGMGRLDSDKATPTDQPDAIEGAVKNKQDPARQINAHETSGRPAPRQPDHSMNEEEPDGWDQAPTDIHDPRKKRHPRHEGKGGTP